MPRAITCVKHEKWKLYWTGWRHATCHGVQLIAQWYAVHETAHRMIVAPTSGPISIIEAPDSVFRIDRQPNQSVVLPSTPYNRKCKIKAELLLALVKFIDNHDAEAY